MWWNEIDICFPLELKIQESRNFLFLFCSVLCPRAQSSTWHWFTIKKPLESGYCHSTDLKRTKPCYFCLLSGAKDEVVAFFFYFFFNSKLLSTPIGSNNNLREEIKLLTRINYLDRPNNRRGCKHIILSLC